MLQKDEKTSYLLFRYFLLHRFIQRKGKLKLRKTVTHLCKNIHQISVLQLDYYAWTQIIESLFIFRRFAIIFSQIKTISQQSTLGWTFRRKTNSNKKLHNRITAIRICGFTVPLFHHYAIIPVWCSALPSLNRFYVPLCYSTIKLLRSFSVLPYCQYTKGNLITFELWFFHYSTTKFVIVYLL